MSSHAINNPFLGLSSLLPGTPRSSSSFSFSNHHKLLFFSHVWSFGGKDKQISFDIQPRCSAISRPAIKGYADVFQNGLPVIKWHEIVEDDIEEEALQVSKWNEIKERVATIKGMLESMEDGEISISAYDTAWVALVEDINGSGAPQFPSSLEWIANNQLSDGSWGDEIIFSVHDRLINTLACVVALKSWNIHQEKYEKGLSFFKENISRLGSDNDEHMPIGFEVAFPSLIEIARSLSIEVPENYPFFQEIYKKRDLKLTRIPKEIMHKVPTTLLHSLEGMADLDWEKLLNLKCEDGSLLFSPSSTAFALMQTKDHNCLEYLTNAVQRFNGGVPNVYPVDMFEHMWAVDRLQRLGISRYFQAEIKECMDYIYRYWTDEGISWARNPRVHDIDDTAMGFRLLRLHGYQVSADVFQNFEKGSEFFCFSGQSNQAVTGMFNLYRASQLQFPGETILESAKHFSSKFLIQKQDANQLLDKWVITKDLPGEVGFALDVPWYASLPRLETRLYIEQYGGQDDVWIGKTLYRMPYVNNNDYLELAKLDYSNCQAVHQTEWNTMQKWYQKNKLGNYGTSRKALLRAYFVASASIYEPERRQERIAWAKTVVLTEMITTYFDSGNESSKQRRAAFVDHFTNRINARLYVNGRTLDMQYKSDQELGRILLGTLNHISFDVLVAKSRDISQHLHHAWETWLMKWQAEGVKHQGEAELLTQTINLSTDYWVSDELLSDIDEYSRLSDLTNKICHQLCVYQKLKVHDNGNCNANADRITTLQLIDSDMQELVQLVLHNSSSDGIYSQVKQTFLMVAKSFYYMAYNDPGTINFHISKVLFDRVN
ncbi:hypothetical protein Dsin_025086 [Dipteronia sinensis]|uniref:Uncharacterized protein n=1 Tax=Dipteronia sinensis TaxID=43782 RepID=A0AAD9ZVQ7_9ROSI|nr:hypothetical protein Dsin_025086 [Dipteronia sinensis]